MTNTTQVSNTQNNGSIYQSVFDKTIGIMKTKVLLYIFYGESLLKPNKWDNHDDSFTTVYFWTSLNSGSMH